MHCGTQSTQIVPDYPIGGRYVGGPESAIIGSNILTAPRWRRGKREPEDLDAGATMLPPVDVDRLQPFAIVGTDV